MEYTFEDIEFPPPVNVMTVTDFLHMLLQALNTYYISPFNI